MRRVPSARAETKCHGPLPMNKVTLPCITPHGPRRRVQSAGGGSSEGSKSFPQRNRAGGFGVFTAVHQRSLLGIWLRAEAAQRGGEDAFSRSHAKPREPTCQMQEDMRRPIHMSGPKRMGPSPCFCVPGEVRNEASSCGCAVLSLGGSMREWDSGPRRWANGSGSGGGTLVKRSLRPNQKCVDPAIKTDVPQ
jgi:hypothetical protein